MKTASKHQLFYFDLIRAFSAQIVVVGHSLNIFLPTVFLTRNADGSYQLARGVFYVQNMGVIIFFVLSGFLVTRSFVGKRLNPEYGLGMYVIERSARLFVPFIPAVVLVSIFDRILVRSTGTPFTQVHLDLSTFVANLLMLFNHPVFGVFKRFTGLDATVGPLGTGAPFWSVTIEWWIYVAFGLIMFRLVTRALGLRGWLFLLFASAVPIWSLVSHRGLLLAWLVGMAYSLLEARVNSVRVTWHRIAAFLGLVIAVVSLIVGDFNVYTEIFVVGLSVTVMSSYWAWFHIESASSASRFVRCVRFASDYSYSLYLIHFSVLIYISVHLSQSGRPEMRIVGGVILCNIVAILFWFMFERHYPKVRRLLSRRFSRISNSRRSRFPTRDQSASEPN